MKTDTIFYRIFQELPSIFFELIGNSPETAQTYQFSSVEIKQTAFRIDGVFLPNQGDQNPIYFVEVQFQTDTEIYSRLFSEIFLYLRQNQPKNSWRGVVIYPTQSLDISDTNNYDELFASGRVTRIYLDELSDIASLPVGIATIKLVVEDDEQALASAKTLIERTQQADNPEPQQRQLLELIETILIYKFPQMNREEIESMFGLSELKQTKFYQEAKQEGLIEGEQKGRLEAKLEAVTRLLALGLTVEQISQALDLEVEQVQQTAQQITNQDNQSSRD